MDMIDILKAAVQKGASDLHLVIGHPPMVRQDGELKAMSEFAVLSAEESRRLIFTLLSDEQRARFEKDWELDFSVTVNDVSRFRANVLIQKNGVEAVMRVISNKIPSPEDLSLPPAIMEMVNISRGLV